MTLQRFTLKADHADRDVLAAIAAMQRDLDAIRNAVERGHNVPSSVSGESFAASTARDLVRAIDGRRHAYETLRIVADIAAEDEVER